MLRCIEVARHREALVLTLLAVATAAIDLRIVQAWSWPAVLVGTWFAATALLILAGLVGRKLQPMVSPLVACSLYVVPITGAIIRWHLHPGKTALIGDGALQTQLAGDFLLKGIDPYGADYARAGLGAAPWGESFPSPALHHLVTWPGQFLWPLPMQVVGRLAGWWDERIFLLGCAVAIWALLAILFPGVPGRIAAVAFFLIPGHSLVAVLGDNDLLMLALLLAALVAADRRRYLLMGLLLGLAVVTKQHAALALPFVVAWAAVCGMDSRAFLKAAATGAATGLLILAPFVIWNTGAFLRDTVVFLAGSGVDAYPINGYGLSVFLLSTGIIRGARDAFPFFLFEITLGLAIWTVGWRWIQQRARLEDVLTFSGLTLLGVLYVSRYFHESHLLLGSELILAGLLARWAAPRAAAMATPTARAA